MTGFFALLRLQLLSRLADLKPRNFKAALKEKKGRTIGMVIAILFLVVYLGVILFIVENKMLDVLMKMGTPDMLISMAVTLATAGTLIMSFFFVLSSLYLGRDAAYLAALPLKSRTIMSAKLVQVWISETLIDALLILPACILFGVKTGAPVGFYLRMILVWLLIALLPICIIAFVSSLLIRISGLWKHRELVVTVAGIALMVGYMFLMMNLGGITGDSAEGGEMMQRFMMDNSSRIQSMTAMFPPAAWAAMGLLGKDPGKLALWVAVSLAAPVITVWLLGYSYRKLSLLQTETPEGSKKKFTGRESYGVGSQFAACCKRELKTILRVPSYATNILPTAFMPLLMVIMMFVISNRVGGDGQNLSVIMQQQFSPALVMSVLAAVLAYMAGMNPALSTAVTREGKGHELLTALPVPAKTLVCAKFAVGFGLALVGVLAASVALVVLFPTFTLQVVLAFILCVLFSYVNSVLALNRDIRKPRLDWVTEQEAVKQNFGVLISLLISWGILIALAGVTYLMISQGLGLWPVFGILAAILIVLCVFVTIRLNKVTEKYYCQG
jgi:ABC-2 type transport system permease protein